MTTYEAILEAAEVDDYEDSVSQIKRLAARSLKEADRTVQVLATEHFNHSYIPDFVLKWPNRPERFVFLRGSSYADEIKDDVLNLADLHSIFVPLGRFRHDSSFSGTEYTHTESLARAADASRSLVTSLPAIDLLDSSPRTGQMLSSFVMRGGKGLVDDAAAQAIAEKVEAGFAGALESDRQRTTDAIQAVEGLLAPSANAEFSRLFEAAWISGGAPPMDFPGPNTAIGEDIPSELLSQLIDIVPASFPEFWEQIGGSVTMGSFEGLHLVGDQPVIQSIMRTAIKRLAANRFAIRKTRRSDQEHDPFLWQVEEGVLSLRGGGRQAWLGPVQRTAIDDGYSLDERPTVSGLATRAENASLTVSDISVTDTDGIVVRFTSPTDHDVATSDLVERIGVSLGTTIRVNEVIARIDSKPVPIDLVSGTGGPRTSSKVSARRIVWTGWNLLVPTTEDIRTDLIRVLGLADDDSATDVSEGEVKVAPTADET